MAEKRLDPYRKVRKRVAPPERTLPDRRQRRKKQRTRREIEEERRSGRDR